MDILGSTPTKPTKIRRLQYVSFVCAKWLSSNDVGGGRRKMKIEKYDIIEVGTGVIDVENGIAGICLPRIGLVVVVWPFWTLS